MTTPKSIIDKSINSILRLGHIGIDLKCFLDCDPESLEECAKYLCAKERLRDDQILLIRTGRAEHQLLPWIMLLDSVIESTRSGMSSKLEEVVVKVLGLSKPKDRREGELDHQQGFFIRSYYDKKDNIREARRHLLAWAKLEASASSAYVPLFSQLVGGVKPIVFVFDDYSGFVAGPAYEEDIFKMIDKESVLREFEERYETGEGQAEAILEGYCLNLNNLSICYRVITPVLRIQGKRQPDYALVASALPFEQIDTLRSRTAAFIVDLEWKPTIGSPESGRDEAWGEMGYRAIHLLSRRYPEIPCFVYTGDWSIGKLQKALVHGASWCFRKTESHHGYSPNGSPELTCIELERSLKAAVDVRYGSFSELPYPNQFQKDSSDEVADEIFRQLAVEIPIGICPKGKNTLKLMAKAFPDGSPVKPTKVLSSGRSKAQATFFIRPSRDGVPLATRFMKMAGWLDIQREYLAYTKVIKPRLNSYVANIIGEPIVADGTDGEMPMGAILYSLAGLPEGYKDLDSLRDVLTKDHAARRDGRVIADRLGETLDKVLRVLYPRVPKKTRKPLWGWLGEILPPVYTGVLIPLECLDGVVPETEVLSYLEKGFEKTEAWRRASESLRKITSGRDDLSPENVDFSRATPILLADCSLLEARWGSGPEDSGQITLAHPDLGLRIRLRGSGADIRRRFSAGWVRPGLPVRVAVCIDRKNQDYEKLERLIQSASTELGFGTVREFFDAFTAHTGVALRDPVEMFCNGGIPYSHVVDAHEGPIHGDLNLGNILFAESGPGWLIDFEYSSEHGMVVYDLAKLEAELWRFMLFPALEQLALVFPKEKGVHFKLLHWAHGALESAADSGETFAKSVRSHPAFSAIKEDELLPARALLGVIATVRKFALRKMSLSDSELRWALAAYFFVSAKFFEVEKKWSIIFGFLSSAMHLEKATRQDPTLLSPDHA